MLVHAAADGFAIAAATAASSAKSHSMSTNNNNNNNTHNIYKIDNSIADHNNDHRNGNRLEMIIFLAIMLHKGPAAFGLISYLINEKIKYKIIIKSLIYFTLAAPISAIITFLFIDTNHGLSFLGFNQPLKNAVPFCLLFSGGTFLYVSAVHVLPELKNTNNFTHGGNNNLKLCDIFIIGLGVIFPLIVSIHHEH